MFSALKKLARSGDERAPAPVPMSSSLQKKFSKGVHFNMKILIKGDRNVGKSCLLQRLQGGPFIEDYVPTDQIQVAPIHWTYKNTDHIVKVEVWEVVDKGRTKKKAPLGLKLENQSSPAAQEDGYETPVLDATFLDVYKNASGVILMLDITKPWTFEYVVKELSRVPADLPVVVLGNHCDMQHHRQVHPHHIDQALHQAKLTRTAPIRYAESSMRNGFGLRLLHKFLSVPFLRLQRTSLLEQLQRNQKDMEEIEKDLDDFQKSEESHYNLFVDRLANKRRASAGGAPDLVPRSPSIVIGAGKPIIPHDVNPLIAHSLNPLGIKAQHGASPPPTATPPASAAPPATAAPPSAAAPAQQQTHYVSAALQAAASDISQPKNPRDQTDSPAVAGTGSGGALDEFYAGALDTSFLEDLTPLSGAHQDISYESDSDDGLAANPKVTIDQDDIDVDVDFGSGAPQMSVETNTNDGFVDTLAARPARSYGGDVTSTRSYDGDVTTAAAFGGDVAMSARAPPAYVASDVTLAALSLTDRQDTDLSLDTDFPLWTGDSSARRSPEGLEDPDASKETDKKPKKKKKSKEKDRGDYSDKSERKDKKHRNKKSKSEKPNPQLELLPSAAVAPFDYEAYDSI